MFGPILHVVGFKAADLLSTAESINATDYGLTMGLQTRNQSRVQAVSELAEVGNLYVNAIKLAQWSAVSLWWRRPIWHGTQGGRTFVSAFLCSGGFESASEQIDLPGPTGELNRYRWMPKQNLWSVGKPGRLAEQARRSDEGHRDR